MIILVRVFFLVVSFFSCVEIVLLIDMMFSICFCLFMIGRWWKWFCVMWFRIFSVFLLVEQVISLCVIRLLIGWFSIVVLCWFNLCMMLCFDRMFSGILLLFEIMIVLMCLLDSSFVVFVMVMFGVMVQMLLLVFIDRIWFMSICGFFFFRW